MNIKNLENKCLKPILYSVYGNNICGDTLQDLLSNMAAYINEVIGQTNDNTKIVQGLYEYVKNEGLKEEVFKQLQEMINNGTFDRILNQELFGDLVSKDEELNKKIDDLKTSLKYLDINDFYYDNANDTVALQRAINEFQKNPQMYDFIRLTKKVYNIEKTIVIGTKDNPCYPIKICGFQPLGSGLGQGKKDVILKRVVDGITMVSSYGHGLELNNIAIDGNRMTGVGIHIIRGFEFKAKNITIMRNNGYGMLLQALSNSTLESIHAYETGSKNQSAIKIKGNKNAEYVSNSVIMSNFNLERNPYTDLDIAYGDEVDDLCEFIMIDNLHIEGTIDNSELVTYKDVPHLLIGNVRGLNMINSFLYGGKGELIRVDKKRDISGSKASGITITNTYLLGLLQNHNIFDKTPNYLINLINGDEFCITNSVLDTARECFINISTTYGKDIFLDNNYYKQKDNVPVKIIIDNRPLNLDRNYNNIISPIHIYNGGKTPSVIVEGTDTGVILGRDGTTYVDLRSSGLSQRDVRISATGGSEEKEKGDLNIFADKIKLNNEIITNIKIADFTPSNNAQFIGQMFLDKTAKKLYIAISVGNGESDWIEVTKTV